MNFFPNYGIEGGATNPCLNIPCKPTIFNHQKVQSQIFVNLALLGHSWPRSSGSKWRAIFGLFWLFLGAPGPKFGTPQHRHTPKWVKTSTRTSCNLFHAVPTVLDHQNAPARALKPTSIIGHKRAILGHRGQQTARRAAEQAPTGKPKVSRVTSGHG